MFILLLVAVPHSGGKEITGYFAIAFCALGAGYCFYESVWGKPQAWADATGITGYPLGLHLRRKFVPWSEVATCEIETYFDTFGNPILNRPILKGRDGEALITLNLQFTKVEDQARLMKYLKARLPKPTGDSWGLE